MKYTAVFAIAACALGTACSSSHQQGPRVAQHAGCHQLGDAQRGASAFYEPGKVYAAKKVEKTRFLARAIQRKETMGATLYMHAQPGLTKEYLQRALVCHAANNQANHPNDPLHPASGSIAEISVESAGSNLAIQVVGEGRESGREIWNRAQAFVSPSTSVTVDQVASLGNATPKL